MRVLITGITGLIGSHLADFLLERSDVEVWGFKRWRSSERNIQHLRGRVQFAEGDIEDPYSVAHTIERTRPDRIFHLAAQSYPAESWNAPATTLAANVMGTVHVLEAARRLCPDARIHVAGSAASYGLIRPDELPIGEDRPLRPVSPYGVSRAAQEMLAYQAAKSYGQQVYITRSFIHMGPRQDARPAAQTFARQIALIEAGQQPPVVETGNLDVRRDFLDVEDAVRAIWSVVEHGTVAEAYNVCSATAPSIRDLLDLYVAQSRVAVEVRPDPARMRPADEPVLLGDNSKLRAATGWEPRVPLATSTQRILDYWRTVVGRDA